MGRAHLQSPYYFFNCVLSNAFLSKKNCAISMISFLDYSEVLPAYREPNETVNRLIAFSSGLGVLDPSWSLKVIFNWMEWLQFGKFFCVFLFPQRCEFFFSCPLHKFSQIFFFFFVVPIQNTTLNSIIWIISESFLHF